MVRPRATTRSPRVLALALVPAILGGILLAAISSWADSPTLEERLQQSTWNPLNPASVGHFRVADPADVGAEEAEAVYRSLIGEMVGRYALSGIPAAAEYPEWTRYNTSPYQSVPHGHVYLNNYANATARAYGRYDKAGILPVGSVLMKDSFTITKAGEALPGPLFAMEKMAPGFNPPTGDWRYTQILPDGSILGRTKGENAENVRYCGPCHAEAGEGRDHVFFPRKRFRRQFASDAE